jgi:hypothetical protein
MVFVCLLHEFSLCVDVFVDAFVDSVDDERDSAHTCRLENATIALRALLYFRRFVNHRVWRGVTDGDALKIVSL